MTNVQKIIIAGCLFLLGIQVKAQVLETKQQDKPDTLTMADRIALRTNTLDWLLLIPNVSAEFDLGKTNTNHWAVGMGVRYNWQTKHHFKPAMVYNLAEVRAEARYYWHTQKIDTTFNINPHERIIEKDDTTIVKKDYLGRLFSTRRYELKHPNTTYYRGAYVAANKYSLLFGKTGHQGKAIQAGFLYGIVKPLYEFKNGNTLDLDLGFSAGICMTTYDEFEHDREDDCYPVTGHKNWGIVPFPVINELRFAFIYRFGSYPLTKKYRWQIDVDREFREQQQAIADSLRQLRADNMARSHEVKMLQEMFNKYYNEDNPDVKKETEKQLQEIETRANIEAKKAADKGKKAVKEAKPAKAEKAPKAEKAEKPKKEKVEKPKKEKKSKKDKKAEEKENPDTPADAPEQPQKQEETPTNEA